MSLIGWYYLHENGALIYKREMGDTAADIRESPFARAMWPVDPDKRETAWRVLVEALALGCPLVRIRDLADKWGCDNDDARVYAERVRCNLFLDGDQWCATARDFTDLQSSPAGFGDTCLEAMADLCGRLGFVGGKMWTATFADLLKRQNAQGATP